MHYTPRWVHDTLGNLRIEWLDVRKALVRPPTLDMSVHAQDGPRRVIGRYASMTTECINGQGVSLHPAPFIPP